MIKFLLIFVGTALLIISIYSYSNQNKTVSLPQVFEKEISKSEISLKKEVTVLPQASKVTTVKIESEVNRVDSIHLTEDELNGKGTIQLSETQVKRIEDELNGKGTIQLSEAQVKRIEDELNGKGTIQLSEAQVKQIEAEINNKGTIQLSEAQVKQIEAEVNDKGTVQLSEAQINKIEQEVKANLSQMAFQNK